MPKKNWFYIAFKLGNDISYAIDFRNRLESIGFEADYPATKAYEDPERGHLILMKVCGSIDILKTVVYKIEEIKCDKEGVDDPVFFIKFRMFE